MKGGEIERERERHTHTLREKGEQEEVGQTEPKPSRGHQKTPCSTIY